MSLIGHLQADTAPAAERDEVKGKHAQDETVLYLTILACILIKNMLIIIIIIIVCEVMRDAIHVRVRVALVQRGRRFEPWLTMGTAPMKILH